MKDYILNNEYIENKDEVINILEKHNFYITYEGKDFMNEEDKNVMYKYYVEIDGVKFDYYEGLGCDMLDAENTSDKIINALWCILNEINYIYDDLDDFMLNYGYEDRTQARKIYNQIKVNDKKMRGIFTEEEIGALTENIQF